MRRRAAAGAAVGAEAPGAAGVGDLDGGVDAGAPEAGAAGAEPDGICPCRVRRSLGGFRRGHGRL